MRIKVMVLALAGVTAAWAVQAEEAEPIEQVVIAGDKLKRTETDSSASVGARNRRQIAESGLTSLDEVAGQMANVGTAENLSIRGVQAYGPTGGVDYSYQRGSHAYGPEYTRNYEASLKGVMANGLMVSMNAYRVNWTDQQVDVGNNTLDVYLVNAGSSRLQGFEGEVRGRVTPQLELFGAVGIARTRFINFVTPTEDFTGKQFARSPREMQSVGFSWTPGRWLLNMNLSHSGSTYTRSDNIDRNDGHTTLAGKASYALSNGVTLFAYGTNLTNRTYITANKLDSVTGRYNVALGSARQFGFGLQGTI